MMWKEFHWFLSFEDVSKDAAADMEGESIEEDSRVDEQDSNDMLSCSDDSGVVDKSDEGESAR